MAGKIACGYFLVPPTRRSAIQRNTLVREFMEAPCKQALQVFVETKNRKIVLCALQNAA